MLNRKKARRFRPRLTLLEDRRTPATLPAGFSEFAITGTIIGATAMEFAPDGKLYVLEQAGTMEVYQGSGASSWTQVAPSNNFFTGNTLTVNSTGERGLLGIAFDPNFTTNRYLYVYYTATAPIHNRISRFTANAAGTQVVPGSEAVLIDLENLGPSNHNGGAMHFGPDGKLYVAVGDNATPGNAQLITNRLGKILRINPVPGDVIPADNPTTIAGIAGTLTGNNRVIWAAGLRNPYTFSFHPTTGAMYINDVGQNTWEEVNVGAAGANYSWPLTEGRFTPSGTTAQHTNPIIAYHHSNGALNYPPGNSYIGAAITGGAFYVAPTYPFPQDYVGDYFFADYVSDWIRKFDSASNTVQNFATNAGAPVDLKVGPDGALYYLAHDAISFNNGRLFRVTSTTSSAPYIVTQPTDETISVGYPVTFTVAAGGLGITYQWQRDMVDIPGATSLSYTLSDPQLSDTGAKFRVRVTNTSGTVTSNEATLTVIPQQPPMPVIVTPSAGTMFNYGDTVNYSGTATDLEDGTLGAAAFTWWVTYHTGPVERPFVPETSGSTSGSFMIPTISPFTEPNVFYRIHLRVIDSDGLMTEVQRDLLPNTVQVTLATNPAGLPLQLDGLTYSAPHVFTGVTGLIRSIGAPESATIGGFAYGFTGWSDAGAIVHDISTPAVNTTYTATYAQRPARVAELRIDEGTTQRSMVRSLRATFDAILNYTVLPADAYSLTGPGGTYPLTISAIDNSSGRSVVTFTFSGPTIVGNSLPDGLYVFTVFGSALVDNNDTELDGDANGTPGGDSVTNFHRLFGDIDGNRTVNVADFLAFRLAFGTSSGGTGFQFGFDYDNDGNISTADFLLFASRFGASV